MVLWAVALARTDIRAMERFGLLSVLPPEFYVGLTVLAAGFSLLVVRPDRSVLLGAHLVGLVAFLHGTPAVLHETLRYSWSWKLLGVIDYIQRHGAIDPESTFLQPFHNWPGFFAWAAFLGDAAGAVELFTVANWAPVYFNLLNLGALALIVSAFTTDRRLRWLCLWFFVLGNWVGQDYFAPQAVSFFLFLVIAGICLNWFAHRVMASPRWTSRWSDGAYDEQDDVLAATAVQPYQTLGGRLLLLTMLLLFLATIAYTHQLTPVIGVLALSTLVLFRRLTLRMLPLILAVMSLTWMAYGAAAFMGDFLGPVLAWFGRLDDTLETNLVDTAAVAPEQVIVSYFSRALSVAVALLALLGVVRRVRHGYWDVTAVLFVLAAVAVLPVSSYGGELLFRIYLFSVPFLAFLAAATIFPSPRAGAPVLAAPAVLLLTGILLPGFLFAYYGKEHYYYFSPQEVEASEYLYNTAPPGSLLIEGSASYPGQYRNYEYFTYVRILREPEEGRERILADPVATMTRWMSNEDYSAAYLIITRSQKQENDSLRTMPEGALATIESQLAASPHFQTVFSNEDASVFTLAPEEGAADGT